MATSKVQTLSTDQIQMLLARRKEQWNCFQQLRRSNPLEAETAREVAIDTEQALVDLGFTVLN
ncbi:MAG: hypothetical protein F6K19_08615 [Cyanothece sp. SIO1E1]|nr:hypothetical protein [Cyanothece sp. SIO1E1]